MNFSKLFENKTKIFLFGLWLFVFSISLYLYFFDNGFITSRFLKIFSSSVTLGYTIFFLVSALRGFTLIPVTYLILIGLIFIEPWPLFIMTLVGVVISSLCVYYFSGYLNFDEYFESKYKKQIDKIRTIILKNELPIVVTWSFMPFLPTDLICYVCGTLDINVRKFIIGVLVGEGLATAGYIFLGSEILNLINF